MTQTKKKKKKQKKTKKKEKETNPHLRTGRNAAANEIISQIIL